MKKTFVFLSVLLFFNAGNLFSQKVEFEEYTLDNGLHVILHQDNSAPVVVTSVMYHVGSKDEDPERTGFAHFFEHLLFEGTQNIGRGDWFNIVSMNGGQNNANTSDDRTYYYEVFPSNNLELGLWMESERMLHPVINQIGVDTQREVIKEEKRKSYDNRPYGQIWLATKQNLFNNHPYRWTTIGSMEHLDAATLDEFNNFFKKYYVPNNAVLVVAGDIDKSLAKKWINDYFGDIPRGTEIVRNEYPEEPITERINATFTDSNIQLPALITAYRIPSMKERDVYTLDLISDLLSSGKSSRLYTKLVEREKTALEIEAFVVPQEDYSMYMIYGIPMSGKTNEDILKGIDEEIIKIQTELIPENEYEKLQNQIENAYIRQNSSVEGVAHNLATYYLLYGNTNLINEEIEIYRSVTREDILNAANHYLKPNQRLVLDYLPENN